MLHSSLKKLVPKRNPRTYTDTRQLSHLWMPTYHIGVGYNHIIAAEWRLVGRSVRLILSNKSISPLDLKSWRLDTWKLLCCSDSSLSLYHCCLGPTTPHSKWNHFLPKRLALRLVLVKMLNIFSSQGRNHNWITYQDPTASGIHFSKRNCKIKYAFT